MNRAVINNRKTKKEIANLKSTLIGVYKDVDTAVKRIELETTNRRKLEKLTLEMKNKHNQFVNRVWKM